jgi:alpha/beta superfamily hydrolase
MPEILISGPVGRLEARYNRGRDKDAPIALLLHPHPQPEDGSLGGSMNTKVIYVMYHTFVKLGYSTLRFNFRGVGKSHGVYDRGEGELMDAAAALDWLQNNNPESRRTVVAGFSFGAWICLQLLMRRPEINRFIAIAPPASEYDFSFLAPCPSSGLVVCGDRDQIVREDDVQMLAKKLDRQKNISIEYKKVLEADHFFKGKLEEFVHLVEDYLRHSVND